MKLVRVIESASLLCGWLAAAAFFTLGLIVGYEVFMRYLFLAPTRWVEEVARLLQIYAVFLAAAWLVARREHIRITVLAAALPPRPRLWLARLALAVVALIASAGAWHAGTLLRFSVEMEQFTDSTVGLPMWLLQAPLVAGLGLASLQALATLWRSFLEPEHLVEAADPASV